MSSEPFIPQDDRPKVKLSELLTLHERTVNGKMTVGLVGEVQSFDAATQTCSVQPVTRARYQNGDTEKLPVIPRVPIRYPQGGGFAITWPLEKGDFVWLDFGERSLEEWKASAEADYAPRHKRRFDITDAVAHAGLSSPAEAIEGVPTDCIKLGSKTPAAMRMEMSQTQVKIGTDTVELLAQIDAALSELNDVWFDMQAALAAVAAGPPATPMTNGTFTTFFATATAQYVTSLALLATIRTAIQSITKS